jgi:hypothetical protein
MEGKCGDWVFVKEGSGKIVENVDFVSKAVGRNLMM